jgi:hypothetical protein
MAANGALQPVAEDTAYGRRSPFAVVPRPQTEAAQVRGERPQGAELVYNGLSGAVEGLEGDWRLPLEPRGHHRPGR